MSEPSESAVERADKLVADWLDEHRGWVEAALEQLQTAVDFFAIEAIAPGDIRADLALIRQQLATVTALVEAAVQQERERCAQVAGYHAPRSLLASEIARKIRQAPRP